MSFDLDETARSFRNLTLSYRGAERQQPNSLQLALRFSKLMEVAEVEGRHLPSMSTEERLRAVTTEFNESAGLAAKHRLDEDRFRCIVNIITGTCTAAWHVSRHGCCFYV